jgi:hypothetical protein
VSLGLKIIGQNPEVITQFVGDQTGGNVPVTLDFSNITLFDTDRVVLTNLCHRQQLTRQSYVYLSRERGEHVAKQS